jgi:hypothetical protein
VQQCDATLDFGVPGAGSAQTGDDLYVRAAYVDGRAWHR